MLKQRELRKLFLFSAGLGRSSQPVLGGGGLPICRFWGEAKVPVRHEMHKK